MRSVDRLRARLPHLAIAALILALLRPDPTPVAILTNAAAASHALAGGVPAASLGPLQSLDALLPDQPAIRGLLARAALAAGDHDLAATVLRSAPKDAGLIGQACLLAQADLMGGDEARALAELQSVPVPCPEMARPGIEMVQALLLTNQRGQASEWVRTLVAKASLAPGDVLRLGLIQAILDPASAPPLLHTADDRSPGGSPVAQALLDDLARFPVGSDPGATFAQIGQTLLKYSEWTLASEAFQEALRTRPNDAASQAYLGLAQDNAGGDGSSALLQSVQLDPSSALAHALLAQHYRLRGQLDLARDELTQAAPLDLSNPAIAAELGATYAELGMPALAETAYRQATTLAPDQAAFWRLLADFCAEHGVDVEGTGLPAARNALALDPQDPGSNDVLGYTYYLLGDFLLAERFLIRSVQGDPLSASSQYHLGLLRLAQGEVKRAQAAFSLAARLDPAGATGAQAARSLQAIAP